jgi:hypothetical protein
MVEILFMLRGIRFLNSQSAPQRNNRLSTPSTRQYSSATVSPKNPTPSKIHKEIETVKQLRADGKLKEAWHKIGEIEVNYPINPKGSIARFKGELGAELIKQMQREEKLERKEVTPKR